MNAFANFFVVDSKCFWLCRSHAISFAYYSLVFVWWFCFCILFKMWKLFVAWGLHKNSLQAEFGLGLYLACVWSWPWVFDLCTLRLLNKIQTSCISLKSLYKRPKAKCKLKINCPTSMAFVAVERIISQCQWNSSITKSVLLSSPGLHVAYFKDTNF